MSMVIFVIPASARFLMLIGIIYFLVRVLANRNRKDEVLLGAAYIMGFEVLARMTSGSFSYEFAKYGVMGFMVLGMIYRGIDRNAWPYFLFILCLVPGVLFSAMNLNYGTSVAGAISFNISGPVCLAITALYCYNRRMPLKRLEEILLAALLPILTMTAYLYVYTPNIRDSLYGTSSNFVTSGGFGPNQVATVLGLGMFILFVRLFLVKNRLVNIIDLGLLGFVSYRAIVTFSRGGVVTAILCAGVFLIVYYMSMNFRTQKQLIPKIILVSVVLVVTWVVTSISTLGLIDKRYTNQDAAGRLKEDITTGRGELIDAEMAAFYENPITGVGIGKVKEYRYEKTGRVSATHNEMSRTMSEHGFFGLISLIILTLTPLLYRIKNRSNYLLFSFWIFWIFTINHSSMRLSAAAFIYGLCLITIINVKKTAVRRK